ncbi:MAG: VTT domain-containing protein [Gammaproteobacteria bacterium]|nr:VTT domain-containing protein [Gammaproteobacteria bacterium]
MAADHTILRESTNCWRILPAERLAFLIDGEAYFRAVREAMAGARHSILILGWDIDTRVRLIREDKADDLPDAFGEFLYTLVTKNPQLQVRVLNWDWAVLYAAERQWLPLYKLDWHRHPRLRYELDDDCPFGASQHQKIVVVDHHLAFVGGMDLSRDRWDRPDHAPGDPLRVNAEGQPYPPFHDIQAMVEGEAALAVDELARQRWWRCTGETLKATPPVDSSPWPGHVEAHLRPSRVGIVRTDPAYNGRPEVREVERLYLDAIAAARRWIYIENQYFSAPVLADALAARLEEPDGPEVVMVLPLKTGGWLEQHTMDVLRSRLLRRLDAARHPDRLRIYYPHREDLGDGYISVHGKVMVVDDTLARVGSANLSNRSMGLDTECDIAVEATTDTERDGVAGLRNRLLAEHLGSDAATVARRIASADSLVAGIEALRGGPRTLEYLEAAVPDLADELLPEHDIVDPEAPITPEELAERLIPEDERKSILGQMGPVLSILAVLLGLAAAWRWTPLGGLLEVDALVAAAGTAGESFGGALLLLAAFVAGGILSVPVTLMIIVTVLVAGPWLGFGLALTGSIASAVASYWIGSATGRRLLRRLSGGRINRLSRRLAQRGILTIITLRIVPVAPFTVINMVAGASHIRFRDFVLGTLVGMGPGVFAIALFTDRVAAAIRKPDLPEFAVLAAVTGGIVALIWGVHNWLVRRGQRNGKDEKA